jgi:hypothetical protein
VFLLGSATNDILGRDGFKLTTMLYGYVVFGEGRGWQRSKVGEWSFTLYGK